MPSLKTRIAYQAAKLREAEEKAAKADVALGAVADAVDRIDPTARDKGRP